MGQYPQHLGLYSWICEVITAEKAVEIANEAFSIGAGINCLLQAVRPKIGFSGTWFTDPDRK